LKWLSFANSLCPTSSPYFGLKHSYSGVYPLEQHDRRRSRPLKRIDLAAL
jgi:hypothetical protein